MFELLVIAAIVIVAYGAWTWWKSGQETTTAAPDQAAEAPYKVEAPKVSEFPFVRPSEVVKEDPAPVAAEPAKKVGAAAAKSAKAADKAVAKKAPAKKTAAKPKAAARTAKKKSA